jgi:4-hydroxy 2-oxovalerate aldolase
MEGDPKIKERRRRVQQQLAYANTIEGIIKNANYLDATLCGLGRAAGNCPLELLIGFLKNPKFDIRPLFDVISREILPLQKVIPWGYNIPYMIAGMLNLHPEAAMTAQIASILIILTELRCPLRLIMTTIL